MIETVKEELMQGTHMTKKIPPLPDRFLSASNESTLDQVSMAKRACCKRRVRKDLQYQDDLEKLTGKR